MKRLVIVALALLVLVSAGLGEAWAKAGSTSKSSGGNMGTRGSRTQDAPMERTLMLPPAQHSTTPAGPPPAPKAVPRGGDVESAPLSPNGTPLAPAIGPGATATSMPGAGVAMPNQQPGFFQRNPMMAGLAGGLLGTGIGSMLFGSSPAMAGEGGGGSGIFTLVLQVLAIGLLAWLGWRLFRGNPAAAGGAKGNPYMQSGRRGPAEPDLGGAKSNPYMAAPRREAAEPPTTGPARGNPYMAPQPHQHVEPVIAAPPVPPVHATSAPVARIDKEFDPSRGDQDAFTEILLGVQKAWSEGNLLQLKRYATSEVVSYLSEDLNRNASEGIANRVENVTLLKGDVSESWSEGGFDYLTAILVFSCHDYMVSVDSGKVVQGNPNTAVTHTEAWTFMRSSNGGRWLLSAVQQVQ